MLLESSAEPAARKSLIQFLLAAFQLAPEAPFVAPDLIRWKYDDPRPDWSGPRSFVWQDGEAIVAHACMCPVTYSLPSGDVSGSYLIDWAAARKSAGAGVALLRSLGRKCDALFAVGGSPDTRNILPKLGYRRIGDLRVYARVLRPWRQFRTDPFPRGWKAPLRLARSFVWSLSPAPAPGPRWSAKPVPRFDASAAPLFEARARSPFACTRRTPELMNYFLQCPGAVWSVALILYDDGPRGWYVLARVGGQTRIADIWVDSAAPADWTAAYALAVRSARRDPQACELVAAAAIPPAVQAAPSAGLRFRRSDPIFVLDPKKRFADGPPLDVTFLESDLAYINDPTYPYLT
ncbi:MAG TPA: hypothetical protein VNY05_11135 [Candidatus Acidoferrales bacterium]|nr:hypothetical protein [Candidatus Acidoferrales bacterium]